MKKLFHIAILGLFPTLLLSAQLGEYVDIKKCDQVIDKQLYSICYSYKNKGAIAGWVRLDGKTVSTSNDIKKRPRFYEDNAIPQQYRTYHRDYKGTGDIWTRGHFVVGDADVDFSEQSLEKAYSMANIIPQAAPVNQKTWTKVENYGRMLASKLGYINAISIASYSNPNQKISNNIVIPTTLYRIYYNNDAKFEKCFKYENRVDIDYKNDKLRDHEVDCKTIKL